MSKVKVTYTFPQDDLVVSQQLSNVNYPTSRAEVDDEIGS